MCEDEERYLREHLAELQRAYQKAAEPYVKRLVEIENLRRPRPVLIEIKDFDASLLDKFYKAM